MLLLSAIAAVVYDVAVGGVGAGAGAGTGAAAAAAVAAAAGAIAVAVVVFVGGSGGGVGVVGVVIRTPTATRHGFLLLHCMNTDLLPARREAELSRNENRQLLTADLSPTQKASALSG